MEVQYEFDKLLGSENFLKEQILFEKLVTKKISTECNKTGLTGEKYYECVDGFENLRTSYKQFVIQMIGQEKEGLENN